MENESVNSLISSEFDYWVNNVDRANKRRLKRMSLDERVEAFYSQLEFGTAGVRARMGLGTNRMNSFNVAKLTQGLSNYLANFGGRGEVCICFDSRKNSKKFAKVSARVLAQNGFGVVMSRSVAPTPYLSFLVRHLGAVAGIMITASHNSKEYNGFKVYGADGGQLTDIDCDKLKQCVDKSEPFIAKPKGFGWFLLKRKIRYFNGFRAYFSKIQSFFADLDENFADFSQKCENSKNGEVKRCKAKKDKSKKDKVEKGKVKKGGDFRVVYTALNGTGGKSVKEILGFLGADVRFPRKQISPNGKFQTCPNPNPENESAFVHAKKIAKIHKSHLILATDPDADRAGVMVRHNGKYVLLSGNETGVLLTNFILQKMAKSGRLNQNSTVIRTVVTTDLVDKIATDFNAKTQIVLTGFKYIGQKISCLESEGGVADFVFGLEDSAGYLAGDYARDKDGVLACGLIYLMANEYFVNGKTLVDGLDELYYKYGKHSNKTLSFKYEGSLGKQKIFNIMDTLRNSTEFDVQLGKNTQKIDFMNPNNPLSVQHRLPLTNMVGLICDELTVFVRTSGTEPLIKVYIGGKNPDKILKLVQNFFGGK